MRKNISEINFLLCLLCRECRLVPVYLNIFYRICPVRYDASKKLIINLSFKHKTLFYHENAS